MKFDRSVSLLSWAYNEEEQIEAFLERAVAVMVEAVEDFEIVLINDGSTDRTGEIADRIAEADPRIRVLHNDRNRNVGYSCKRAIASAAKEYLFWQMVDWSYDIKHLRTFLELLKHYDAVQGVRPTPIRLLSYIPIVRSIYRVKTRSDSFYRAIISLANYYLLRILYGVKFHDFQNVTFYPTRLIQSVELLSESSFLNPECLYATYAQGATFIEVPIGFLPREVGDAKGAKPGFLLRSLFDVMRNAPRLRPHLSQASPKAGTRQIYRVAEPFFMDDEPLRVALPLFKELR